MHHRRRCRPHGRKPERMGPPRHGPKHEGKGPGRGRRGRRPHADHDDHPPERDYARTTITVPRELKARMKAIQGYVNWSAVARQAFEAKLSEITSEEEIQDMQEVVDRLKRFQTHIQEAGNEYDNGLASGKKWAMNQAAPDQLQRIQALRDSASDEDAWKTSFLQDVEPDCGWRRLAYAIDPSADPERGARGMKAKHVMRRILGHSNVEDLHFFRGFADGALEVWRVVKDQL